MNIPLAKALAAAWWPIQAHDLDPQVIEDYTALLTAILLGEDRPTAKERISFLADLDMFIHDRGMDRFSDFCRKLKEAISQEDAYAVNLAVKNYMEGIDQ